MFDIDEGKVNYNNMKVTDIPTVRRLNPPKAANIEVESYFLNTKRLLLNTVREYMDEKCDKKGHIKMKNISKTEEEGIKEVENELKNGKVVFTSSTKLQILLRTGKEVKVVLVQKKWLPVYWVLIRRHY